MKTIILLAVTLLFGCGRIRVTEFQYAKDPLVPFFMGMSDEDSGIPCIGKIRADFPIHYKQFTYDLIMARKLMDDAGIIETLDFCSVYSSVNVHIHEDYLLKVLGTDNEGFYDVSTKTVNLNRFGQALAHELLHHLDAINGVACSMFHCGWNSNNYANIGNIKYPAINKVYGIY